MVSEKFVCITQIKFAFASKVQHTFFLELIALLDTGKLIDFNKLQLEPLSSALPTGDAPK